MRYFHAVFIFFCIICLLFSFGLVGVSASSVEDPTVSDPEVVLSVTSPDQEQEDVSLSDSGSDIDTPVMLAADSESGLAGLASWNLTGTPLGSISLYLAQDINSSGIKVVDNQLVNFNNSTVYFYSPEYPSYTFSASRFSPVYYRPDTSGYQSTLLTSSDITVDQVEFNDFYSYIVIGLLLVCLIFLLWRCIFK